MTLMTLTVDLSFKGGPTGEYDDLGRPIIEEPTAETWPAWYEPRTSTEAADARHQVVSGYMVYLPLDAPLDAADDVVIEGKPYEVQGDPGRQPGGFLVEGYQLAAVERIRG